MSAMALINEHNINALLVVEGEGKRVEGIVGLHDLLKLGVA
jgi:CBS domain-containing protein